MPRVDVWDAAPLDASKPIEAGFPRGFEDKFTLARELGSGGFGSVRVAVEKVRGGRPRVQSMRHITSACNSVRRVICI